jgi:hypothetical protein
MESVIIQKFELTKLCLKTYDVAQCSAIGAEYDSQGQARRKSGARRPWLMM